MCVYICVCRGMYTCVCLSPSASPYVTETHHLQLQTEKNYNNGFAFDSPESYISRDVESHVTFKIKIGLTFEIRNL